VIQTRWMRGSDVADAIRISSCCGGDFSEKNMRRLFSKQGFMCMVAEVDEKVAGVIVYDSSRVSKIKVVLVAVDEPFRRTGVGRSLMSLITSKLDGKRNKAEMFVSEYNLPAHLFLKAVGFRAVSIVGSNPDASEYKFLFRIPEMAEGANQS